MNKKWVTVNGAPDAVDWSASAFDSDGNIIVVGNSFVAPGNPDILLTKYDRNGDVIWSTTYGGSAGAQDYGAALTTDQYGNIYVAGVITSATTFLDVIVLKYSPSGYLLWNVTYNGIGNLADVPSSIRLAPDGSIYVAGSTYTTVTNPDYLILKVASTGILVWSSIYDHVGLTDIGTSIELDSNDDPVVTGGSASSVDSWDYATVRFNKTDGVEIDVRRVEIPGLGLDNALAFARDGTGGLFVTGYRELDGSKDVQTIKLNAAFELEWVVDHDVEGEDDLARSIDCDADGNIYVAGSSGNQDGGSAMLTIKYATDGSLLWAKQFKAPQSNWIAEATKCAATEDGGVIVVGTVFDGTSNNFQTLKYSAIGELEWEKKYDALEGNDKALGLLVDGDRVYVNGISNNGTGNKYTTIHYTYTERVHDMIYSAEGAPICKADEMIIRLRPEFVNTSVADNKGWQYGTLDEVVSSAVADQIAEKAGHGPLAGKSTKVYKVFRHTTRADSISRTRLGREEEMPTVWCTFLIEADLGANIQATVDSVSTLSDQLEFAQLNLFYPFLCDVCEDPLLDRQPNLFPSTEYPNADINVQQAWDLTQAIPEVKVGIVDQFVDYEHEDFNECATNGSSIVDGHDFMANYNWIFWQEVPDYPSHGTASAGIIGAIRNNCIGIAGIAGKDAEQPESGCTLYTIGIADQSFYGSFSDVIAPALYSGTVESNTSEVTFGCNVLNNGYGVNGQFAIDFALREAIRACYRNECVFVAARGNGGGPPHYPADFSSSYNDYAVLAVGASGPDGSRMTPTNGGVYLTAGGDLIAPGYQGMVTSTINAENDFVFTNECTPLPDPYSCFRWSSAAAPHASGVAALMQSTHHPAVGSLNGLAPEDVEIIMEKAATDIGSSYGYPDGPDDFNGYGRLNAGESVRLVKTPYRVFHSGPPITTDVTVMTTQTVSMPGISQGWAFTWGLPPGDYEMTEHRFELTYTNTFEPNTEILDGWGRNSSVFGNLDPHFDHTAEWEFAIDGNSANVVGRTSCWKVTNGPDGPMQFWIPVDPSKISTPYSLHLYEEIISSVAEAESNSFALYPNPATTELRIAFNGIAARRLEVVDITGRIVKTEAIAVGTPNIEISIAHLAQGTYSLRVTGTNGGHTQRFIKY